MHRGSLPTCQQHHLHGPAVVRHGDAGEARVGAGVFGSGGLPVKGSPARNREAGKEGQGHRQLAQSAHGAQVRAAMDWSGMAVARAPLLDPRDDRRPPWKKQGFDHRDILKANRHCRSHQPWPQDENALAGAVMEWNGMPAGRQRVPRPARPAFGKNWEVRVGADVEAEAFSRAVPRQELGKQRSHAPWERDGADALVHGLDHKLLVDCPGRRGGRAQRNQIAALLHHSSVD